VRWTGRRSGVVDLTGGCGTCYGIPGSRGISQGWDRSNGSGSCGMSWDVAGQLGRERKASGRCEVPRGLQDVMVCCMMSRDVGKGLDPKRDERETSCTTGDELCRGRQDMLRETRHTMEGGSEAEGTVKQSGVRGFPLHFHFQNLKDQDCSLLKDRSWSGPVPVFFRSYGPDLQTLVCAPRFPSGISRNRSDSDQNLIRNSGTQYHPNSREFV